MAALKPSMPYCAECCEYGHLASQHNGDVCVEQVGEPPGYYHWHTCGRKAKWLVRGYGVVEGKNLPVCGIHVKWYQRQDRVLRRIDVGMS